MHKFIKMSLCAAATVALMTTTAFAGGGVLKRDNGGEPSTLDPHFASGTWENSIIGDMFMGLTTEDSKGVLIPGLAESWTVSDDGLTLTFKIRDAVWSDGTEITANDFEYSFKRILDPETAAKYAFMLHPIKGAVDFNEGKTKTLGVKAVDKDTLEIHLEAVTPYFLESLSHFTAWAVPQHIVEKYGKEWARKGNIVVSGAFTLESWVPNSKIALVKNPKFFDAANVSLDGVEFFPIEKASAALKRWKANELHTSAVPPGMLKALQKEYGDQVRVSPRLGTYYYAINPAVVTDNRIRTAMNMAINREIITDKIVAGGQIPAYSWVPPGTNNYPNPAVLSFKNMTQAERNAKAKELMEQAGYSPSNPFEVELSYNTSEGHKKIAVAVSAMWKPIGIKTTLSNTEVKTHYKQLQNQEFEVGRAGWIGDYNDPYTFLELFEEGISYNYGKYNNPKYDAAMEKASQMAGDLMARAEIMREAEQMALDENALIPVYYYVNMGLVKSSVKGWDDNLMGTHRSRFVSID